MSHQVPFRAYPTWVLISQFLCVKDWHFGVLALFATKERGTARTTFCWMWLNVHNWYFNIFHDYIQWCWIISEIKSKYLDIVLMTYECACIYIYVCVLLFLVIDILGIIIFHRDSADSIVTNRSLQDPIVVFCLIYELLDPKHSAIDWRVLSGWWFGTFFVFHDIWDNPSQWLIFFRGVETTNQLVLQLCNYTEWSNYTDLCYKCYLNIFWSTDNMVIVERY